MTETHASHTRNAVKDPAFALRMEAAADGNPAIPAMNYGRLTWIQQGLKSKFGVDVSLETVRKWYAGESRPRPVYMSRLAEFLQVDEAWLAIGVQADLSLRDRKLRNAMANGAVNVLAGFIQMAGGHPAFPDEDDKRAESDRIDLYAIIKGASYPFGVALASIQADGTVRFPVPTTHENLVVIGVIPGEGFSVEFVELKEAMIAANSTRKAGATVDVTITRAEIDPNLIATFAERL